MNQSTSLSTEEELRAFSREVIDEIEQGGLAKAEQLIQAAIQQSGSADLEALSDLSLDSLEIDGWEELCLDLLEAGRRSVAKGGEPVSLAVLSLENYEMDGNNPLSPLKLNRKFYTKFKQDEISKRDHIDYLVSGTYQDHYSVPYEKEKLVGITGLESVRALQQASYSYPASTAAVRKYELVKLLSGLFSR